MLQTAIVGGHLPQEAFSRNDGGGLKHTNWLAGEWQEDVEFSKSKGWIKDYEVFTSVHARSNEPDIYLVTVTEKLVSGAKSGERGKAYRTWRKKTIEQMQSESGNRAEYRQAMSESLLQKLNLRK